MALSNALGSGWEWENNVLQLRYLLLIGIGGSAQQDTHL